MITLAALAVFSGLSLNLLLSFALGASGIALPKGGVRQPVPLFQLGAMATAVLFLWVFFSFALPSFWRGFAVYFLLFPLSALACMALELLRARAFPKASPHTQKAFSAFTAYDGLVPASLLLTLMLAGNFAGAAVLALFFALGNLMAILILNEIRRRSSLERVPGCLRGGPLALISMGLLAAASAAAAGICFRILEVFR